MRSFEGNRVVRDTGARHPIFNAPIGYFARSSLAGAVSAAGGMGLMEMSTMTVEEIEREHALVRSHTDAPFGLHMFLRALQARDRLDEVLDWALGLMSSVESPVHQNWKDAVAETEHTLNIDPGMPNMRMRVVRNSLS